MIKRFIHNQSGATAIEYSLIAAFVGGVLIVAITAIGVDIKAAFPSIGAMIKSKAATQ